MRRKIAGVDLSRSPAGFAGAEGTADARPPRARPGQVGKARATTSPGCEPDPAGAKERAGRVVGGLRAVLELLVALGAGEDDVHPDPHRLRTGGHQVVGPLVRLDHERQVRLRGLHGVQVVHVDFLDRLQDTFVKTSRQVQEKSGEKSRQCDRNICILHFDAITARN